MGNPAAFLRAASHGSRLGAVLGVAMCLACGSAEVAPDGARSQEEVLRAEDDWVDFARSIEADAALQGDRATLRKRRMIQHPGRFRERNPVVDGLSAEQRATIDQLEAIGYAQGSRPTVAQTGVVAHEPDRAQPGYNFVLSGHAAEAWLMDMDGNRIHRWAHPFELAFPERTAREAAKNWRRAYLYENGDVLAIHEGLGLVKIDKDSKLQWARFNRAHHDLAVVPDGDIYVLTRGARLAPEVDRDSPILEDFISILDPDGVEKRRISLLEVFESSAEQHSWRRASRDFWSKEATRGLVRQGGHGDLFHTNALEVLDGRPPLPGFEAGHLLLSFRNLDRIAVIDPESEQVMWSLDARTSMQHDPSVTPEGGVLVFDNHWRPGERSRVVLLDPRDGSVMWQYHGPDEAPLYSETCGSAVQLANGNVLITESDNGHALEVTGEGEVVWDFYNPQVAGKNAEFIATLFDLVRLPPDFRVDWAEGAADGLGD